MAFSDYFSQLVSPPSYLDGIITPEQRKAAQQQSMFQGLLGAGLSYLSQPKNQGYGSAVPYLAKAGLSGLQAAQAPYAQLEKDVLMKQKFDEITRQNQEREALKNAIETAKNSPNITEAQRLGLDISPKETITSMMTNPERKVTTVDGVLVDNQTGLPIYGAPTRKTMITPNGLLIYEDTGELVTEKSFVDPTPLEKNWESMVRYGTTGKYKTFSDYVAANTTAAGVAPQQQILNDTFKSTVQGIVDTANSNRSVASQIDTINALLKDKPGGGIVKVSADLQSFLGLETPNANVNQIIEALRTRGGVQVRAPGSGSTSDLEFKSYMTTFPSLSTTPKGRELMGLVADAGAKRSAKLADWSSQEFAKGTFSYERLRAYDEGLGKVLSDDIAKKIREQVEVSGGTFVPYNDVFKKADSLILGVNN
jgi:hypothetical protein